MDALEGPSWPRRPRHRAEPSRRRRARRRPRLPGPARDCPRAGRLGRLQRLDVEVNRQQALHAEGVATFGDRVARWRATEETSNQPEWNCDRTAAPPVAARLEVHAQDMGDRAFEHKVRMSEASGVVSVQAHCTFTDATALLTARARG